jgi:hypothetical protein
MSDDPQTTVTRIIRSRNMGGNAASAVEVTPHRPRPAIGSIGALFAVLVATTRDRALAADSELPSREWRGTSPFPCPVA